MFLLPSHLHLSLHSASLPLSTFNSTYTVTPLSSRLNQSGIKNPAELPVDGFCDGPRANPVSECVLSSSISHPVSGSQSIRIGKIIRGCTTFGDVENLSNFQKS